MSQNLLIYGLDPENDREEDTKEQLVLDFFKNKMLMEDIQDEELLVTHRIGKRQEKPRPVVVRCTQSLKNRVFSYTKNLKSLKNSYGDPYVVKTKLPEPLATQRKEREMKICEIHIFNEQLTSDQSDKKKKIEVKN